jgi:hypothetical protein
MSHRNRRRIWLLAVAILALALPQVAAARGEHRGGGSHDRGGHGSRADRQTDGQRGGHQKYSPRDFGRRDHRGRARPERKHIRHDRSHVRDDRRHVRDDRRHVRDDRRHAGDDRRHAGRDRGYARPARHDRHADRHVRHHRRHDAYASRHYPRYGHHVYRLPRHYLTISLGGHHHYYYHGVWYRPYHWGFGYVVTTAPIGAVVSVLPPYYTTLWVHDVPYYYANYTYYRWSPPHDGYLVVEDPGVDGVVEGGDELFVYPNAGQSEEQQADDRYACHRWAVEETGYDPSLIEPGGDESALPGLRDDYQRAMSACLEGRDYTVR